MIVNHYTVFLKKEFIQDRDSERKIKLEEKISEEHRVQKSEPIGEPVNMVCSPPYRSSRIFRPPERYLDILTEDLEEVFFMEDRDIRNDPKIYDEAMLDVDSEKWK